MSITRLQQARQMYAMGQRVAKTLDGSRPGYGGPQDYGDEAAGRGACSGSGDTGDFGSEKANVANTKSAETNLGMDNRDRAIANQYKNMPTPTVTLGEDKFGNPITVKTTYQEKRARQQVLDALNKKGISSFDPRVTKKGFNFLNPNNLINSFAPKEQKKFGIMDLALIAASGGLLGPKIATGAKMFNTAKSISKFANNIGLTDTNVIDSFTSNFSDKFNNFDKGTTTKNNTINNTINNGGGEGITSLENQAGNYDEYILLLQKLQTGNISDAERNRYNVLKSNLGI